MPFWINIGISKAPSHVQGMRDSLFVYCVYIGDKLMPGITFEVAGIRVSFNSNAILIRRVLENHYKEYLTKRKPHIQINVKYSKEQFDKPDFDRLIFKDKNSSLGYKKKNIIFYNKGRKLSSFAVFNSRKDSINFYTQDKSGHLLLYLFPGILYSMILYKYNAIMLDRKSVV